MTEARYNSQATGPGRGPSSAGRCRVCGSTVSGEPARCAQCAAQWPADKFLGQILAGDIRIDTVLGRGGMAVVYLATQLRLERQVAVKRLIPGNASSARDAEWFRREARVLSQLHHPNLVSVLDFGTAEDGSLYLVMEYVRGLSLRKTTRGKPQSSTRALNVMAQVLAALEEVHRKDIVHRDLKPENVLVESVAGEKDHVKLADFGVAHIANSAGTASTSGRDPSGPVGTPAYMAPEQVRAEQVDTRADIYAAGVLLFELLTGTIPHKESGGATQMLIHRASEPAQPPSVVRPELPISRDLDSMCVRALAVDPADRYPTAAAFREDVLAASEERKAAKRRHSSVNEAVKSAAACDWTVLALRPRVEFGNASGIRTQVERLMLVWDLVERYASKQGGHLTPPDGPTAYVLFENPPNASAVPRAASTALALVEKVQQHFPDTHLGCGIASGEIPGYRQQGTAPPSAACLSVARSLARSAGSGRVMVEPGQSSRLTGAYQKVAATDGVEVLSGPGSRHPTGNDSVPPVDTSPNLASMRATLSGRAVAWDRLSEALSSVRASRPGAAFVLTGPVGVGKSQLCRAVARMASPGTPVVWAEAHPGLGDRPYRPLLDLVAQMAVPPGETVSRSTILDGLLVLGLPAGPAKALANQWEAGSDDDPWVALSQSIDGTLAPEHLLRALHLISPLERRMALTAALSEFASTVAGPNGCLFVIEDVDRADEATVAAIDGLVHASRQSPVLVLVTARRESTKDELDADWIELAPLGTDDRIALWASLAPKAAPPDTTRRVLRLSEGLPLYLRHAAECAGDGPDSPAEILEGSFAQLEPATQKVLSRAAALGECFQLDWLSGDIQAVERLLQTARHWVVPQLAPGSWKFVSTPLFRVARARMSAPGLKQARLETLQRIARDSNCMLAGLALHHRVGNQAQASRLAERLGDRFLVAGAPRRAADWYRVAASGRTDDQVPRLKAGIAEFSARRNEAAVELLAPEDFTDLGLRLLAAQTLVRAALSRGDITTAQSVAARALRDAPEPGPQTARLMLLLSEVYVRAGRPETALRAVATTERVWQSCPNPRPPGLGWRCSLAQARVHQLRGESDAARQAIALASERAAMEQDDTGLIQCLAHLAPIELREARGEELKLECDRLFVGEPPKQISHRILWWRVRGQACGATGDLDAARECFEHASNLASAAGSHVARELQTRLAGELGPLPNPSRWLKSRHDG